MNKKVIGKFISSIRNEKGLTQEDLANKSGTPIKKIKKIEKGRFKIDLKNLIPLCKSLKISSCELLNGHKGNTKMDQEEAVIKLVKYRQEEERKGKIILNVVAIIGIIICIICFIWGYNNKDLVYKLNGESENFSYQNSLFIRDNGVYIMIFGNFEIKNENILEENISRVAFKCNDRLIIASSDFLYGDAVERKGYDELFPKEVVQNIDDWYIEITYNWNNELITEIIELNKVDLN